MIQAPPTQTGFLFRQTVSASFCRVCIMGLAMMLCVSGMASRSAFAQAGQQSAKAIRVLPAQEVESTFPPSVYFRGKTAPVQLRNASAARFADDSLVFAGLVDNSGYASNLRETYQMYLLTDKSLLVGDKLLPAGAYGAGFVGEGYIVMDIGGRTVAEGETHQDDQITRPRPLQLLQPAASSIRLYLGRRWVLLGQPPTSR